MTVQARMSQSDERLYNPSRDLAHNFDRVAMIVAKRLEGKAWPIVADVCAKYGVTLDQLGEACRAFCEYVASATTVPKESMEEALTRVGWFKVPDAAQMAYMAYLGTAVSGMYYAGVREATLGGSGPTLNYQHLYDVGLRSSQFIGAGRLRRWYIKLRQRLGKAWRVIRGTEQ